MKYFLIFYLIIVTLATAQEKIPPLITNIAADIDLADSVQAQGTLTITKALNLAMRRSPILKSYSLEIRIKEAAALQASLIPNPELDVELENFAGSGPLRAFKASETTISVGQLIELAGKRGKRTRLAELEKDLARFSFRSKQLDVFLQTVISFNRVLVLQELVKLNKQLLKLAREFKMNIERRVRAGRLSPAELDRAEVEVANAQIAWQRRTKELIVARHDLAAVWGSKKVTFQKVQGNLEILFTLPSFEKLLALLKQNPDWARWETVHKRSKAAQSLAQAYAIPDPVIRIGWRTFNESRDRAFVAGFSLPLPIFNRNQGTVQESALRMRQSTFQEGRFQVQLQARLTRLYQGMKATYQTLRTLKNNIIPQAQQAFRTIKQGYQQGKFGFLDVLDAQRTLFASRESYIQNVGDYQLIRAQIERLIGQSLQSVH